MGGINHQPTKKQFEYSTMLSQYFSDAIAKLMFANYELEQALLAEMGCAQTSHVAFLVERARMEIGRSAQALTYALDAVDLLLKKMTEMGYTDPSRFTVTDYRQLEIELTQQGLIPSNTPIWDELSRIRQTEAFFGVCELFKEKFADLITATRDVEKMFEQAVPYATEGKLVSAIDENQIPFRQSFFRLITKMIETITTFAQSAAMSTEMYYRQEGYGTLLAQQSESIVA
jgi:hypothetical protein